MKHTKVDIIILGGGLVGLTMANLCAKQDLTVLVVELQKPIFDWPKNSSDLRCSAISRSSQKIFERLNIWETIVERASPYRHMVVWDAEGFGEITFDAVEVAEPDLGHIIENRVMLKTLWESAEQDPNINLLTSATPIGLTEQVNQIILTLKDNSILQAKLLIGADGARSWVRETAKIKSTKEDYHQSALVATVKTEMPHHETAWQRFLPTGPLAFLPLQEPYTSSIVWTATHPKIKELLDLSDEQFCQEVAHGFDYRLGKVLTASERLSFPLQMSEAKHYIKERVALMGDAAHVIHPLAGQGVNLGLSDAEVLSEILSNAKQNDGDIGNYLILRKYERARKGQVGLMIKTVGCFNQLFRSDLSLLMGARSVGLNFVNKCQFLKKKIIMQAMGI